MITELSASMKVGKEWLTTTCKCVTCQNMMQVVMQTEVITFDNKVFSFKRPDDLKCNRCGSPYIRWGD